MTLPTPVLDDRRFQDIVDEAKTRIPQYCQEWTDHNVSDPGVALIELFAWMTDMLLYRVNQVPEKLYVTFLELMGIQLEAARAAHAPVTFYLSAAQPIDVTIPEGTEVATVRTETSAAIVFTTEANLTIRTVNCHTVFTRAAGRDAKWVEHDLDRLADMEYRIPAFTSSPRPVDGDALYFGFDKDHSRHVLAVRLNCHEAGGPGIIESRPPVAWQAWQGVEAGWTDCDVEFDGTRGLNAPGEVIVHTPHMAEGALSGKRGWWLRCLYRPYAADAGDNVYTESPRVGQLMVEARGGTIGARHAVTVRNEVIGHSDGTAGQTFRLANSGLLERDGQREYLVVEPPGGEPQRWAEVEDFADSGDEDRHYTLDSRTGTLTFGPSLLQPNGEVYGFGAVPAKGSRLRFERYQYGGGIIGNAPAGALTVLKSSIPYVRQVNNRGPAMHGRNAESVERAKLRAPHVLRSRSRAVTADDYEHLATQLPQVARAYCLAPGAQPGGSEEPRPGRIVLLILPQIDEREGSTGREGLIKPDQLVLGTALAREVQSHLDLHRLLGTTLEVRAPRYAFVAIAVTLRVSASTESAVMDSIREKGEAALYRYLNPYVGGPQGNGWPLGRDLHRSELFGLLQQIPGVEYADDLHMTLVEPDGSSPPRSATQRLVVSYDGVVVSAQHQVKVEVTVDEG